MGELSVHPSSTIATVPRVLSQDYEGYATSFFFSSYALPLEDAEVPQSFLDCLYPVWLQTDLKSPLRPALAAVGSCLLEAWVRLKSDVSLSLSRSHYITGVAALRKCLQGTELVGDDVLLAALLLDMYENLLAFFTGGVNESAHASGATTLVEYWRRRPPQSNLSQRVLMGARKHVVGKALIRNQAVPSNVSKWRDMVSGVPMNTGQQLEELTIEVANLQARALHFRSDMDLQSGSALTFLKQATELDQRLSTWMATLPDDWIPVRVSSPDCIPPSVRNAGVYNGNCDIHKSISTAFPINNYCCARIRVQLAILTCLEHVSASVATVASATASSIIQDLADTMCASVPFFLGDRTSAARLDDRTAQYPHPPGCSVPSDHYTAAAAQSGWFISAILPLLLSPGVSLRMGQKQWIVGQLQRTRRVYVVQP